MSREEALEKLKKPAYDPETIHHEFEYVASKLDWSVDELVNCFNAPNKSYKDYANQEMLYNIGAKTLRAIGIEMGGEMIGVLDYGVGNVGAFIRIFHSQNINAMNIKSPSDFDKVDKIILPGVGSFDSAIDKLNSSGLRDRLDDFVLRQNYPLLAVCIGMHMLGNSSEEGSLEGLGYINGQTKKIKNLDEQKKIYIPHMGWNSIEGDISNSIWLDIDMQEGFYFFTFIPL